MKRSALFSISFMMTVLLTACQGPGHVVNKVLTDFGVRKPAQESTKEKDKVFARLTSVGESEMKRMNQAGRHGIVKFEEREEMRGKFYKEVKVYENFFPIDAQALGLSRDTESGFAGYIEFEYRLYQSERKPNRTEAAAQEATIPTEVTGRERYRYTFNSGGEWNARQGQRIKE